MIFSPVILLLACGLLFLWPALRLWKLGFVGRPRVGTRCYRCGYDLASAPAACPECGAASLPPGTRPPFRPKERAAVLVLAALLSVTVVTAGHIGWVWFTFSSLYASIFGDPNAASTGRLSKTASTLQSFASGHGSRRSAIKAVADVFAELSRNSFDRQFPQPQVSLERQDDTITGSFSAAEPAALAQALDSSQISADDFDALLAAICDSYRKTPLTWSTQVDIILCDLLSASRTPASGGGSSDYLVPSTSPRTLTDAQRQRLVGLFLDLQGRHDRLWNHQWGAALESLAAAGKLSAQEKSRYLEQAVDPRLVFQDGEALNAGDAAPFVVAGRWRLGSNMPVRLRVSATDPDWKDRIRGDATLGSLRIGTANTSERSEGWALLPDRTGKETIALTVEVDFGPDVVDAYCDYVNPPPGPQEQRSWRAFHNTTVRKTTKAAIELAPSPAQPLTISDGGVAPEALWNGRPMYVNFASTPGGLLVRIDLGRAVTGMGLAGRVSLRQDGVDYPIGWAFSPRLPVGSVGAMALIPGLTPDKPAQFLFESDPGLLARPVWTPQVWKGRVVRDVHWSKADWLARVVGPSR